MNKVLKRVLLYFSFVLAAILLFVLGYVIFILLSYSRIDDNLNLDIDGSAVNSVVEINEELSISSYNIGFGAYSQNYTFFLDSAETVDGIATQGYYGTALNKEEVLFNTNGAIKTIKELNPDFAIFQEVDIKVTRSYKIDQYQMIKDAFNHNNLTYGINFDTAFLPYPLYDMHGKTLAGIATASKYQIQKATRISLPIADNLSKLFDLDRCFVINEFKTSNDNKLIIVNIHMSAYDEGGVIRKQQLDILNKYLIEWEKLGYYVIVGGDFNHDLLTFNPLNDFNFDTKIAFKEFINHKKPDWLQMFFLEDGTGVINEDYRVIASSNAPTNRDASVEWEIGKGYVSVIDGFIVSKNIEVITVETIITKNGNKGLDHFAYSDHDPTLLKFKLK